MIIFEIWMTSHFLLSKYKNIYNPHDDAVRRVFETQCNKARFHLFKINVHWSCNAARSHKNETQTQKPKLHTIAWIYSSCSFIWNKLKHSDMIITDLNTLALTNYCQILCTGIIMVKRGVWATFPFPFKSASYSGLESATFGISQYQAIQCQAILAFSWNYQRTIYAFSELVSTKTDIIR